jgi:type IV/VI secretion system ImpK/VasF family protein
MSTPLMDLGSQVLLFVARFRRQARRASGLSGDGLREEAIQLFRELDQQAQVEAALTGAWESARKPLVYLVDEIMINTEWEYRGWWADNSLETALLSHPQKMRGILFFDELDTARQSFDKDGSAHAIDLLTLFYCALRFGFEGKFVGQPSEIEREAQQIYAKLPDPRRHRARELFSEAYEHTVEIPPNYETYMRLATLVGLAVGMIVLFVGIREYLWTDLLHDLEQAATSVGSYFGTSEQS